MLLNDLPWNRTKSILSFLRLHPSSAFWSLVGYDSCTISSKRFFPTVVDAVVIWIKICLFSSILVNWFKICWCSRLLSPVWPLLIYLIHGPNIPGFIQYCPLQHWTLLSPPDTSTTGHHLHLLSLFIPSGATSLLFSSSILNTYGPGMFIFQCHIFFAFSYVPTI